MTVIDMWTDPSNPPNPQQFPRSYAPGDGITKLLDKIKAVELQVKESTSNLLRTAGIRLTPAGMTIDSNLAVTGTLSLPAGIIDNDALANPIVPGIVNFTATGFTVPVNPTWGNAAATTITVPAGCTQLLATCTGEAYAINPNTTGGSNGTGGDILDCRVLLNGSASTGYGIGLSGSNGFTTSSSSGSFQFSGLTPGATLSIAAQVLAVYQALGSNVVNKATINATLVWLR